jgi:hypothetical protein
MGIFIPNNLPDNIIEFINLFYWYNDYFTEEDNQKLYIFIDKFKYPPKILYPSISYDYLILKNIGLKLRGFAEDIEPKKRINYDKK